MIQIDDLGGQANSLNELGILYDNYLNRPEEAVTFYRLAADMFVALGNLRYEGVTRNNIARTLRKLKRYDEARSEIVRAIECKSHFGHAVRLWTSFRILQDIETITGNPEAAQAAWKQARDAYLAYRQQGSYAQTPDGQLSDQILTSVLQGASEEAVQFLTQATQTEETPSWFKHSAPKLLAILNGSRDAALAGDMELDYDDAAEILFLIQRLSQS